MKSFAMTTFGISCLLLMVSCAREEMEKSEDLSTRPTVIEVTATYDPKLSF